MRCRARTDDCGDDDNKQRLRQSFIYEITDDNFIMPHVDHTTNRDRSEGSTPHFAFKVLSKNPITRDLTCRHALIVDVNNNMYWRALCKNCGHGNSVFARQDNFIHVLIPGRSGDRSSGCSRRQSLSHACMIRVNRESKTLQYFNPSRSNRWSSKEVKRQVQWFLTRNSRRYRATFNGWRWMNDDQTYFIHNGQLVGPQSLINDQNCGIWCILWAHLCSCNPKMPSRDIWWSFCTHFINRYGGRGWRHALMQWMQRYKYWCKLLIKNY